MALVVIQIEESSVGTKWVRVGVRVRVRGNVRVSVMVRVRGVLCMHTMGGCRVWGKIGAVLASVVTGSLRCRCGQVDRCRSG